MTLSLYTRLLLQYFYRPILLKYVKNSFCSAGPLPNSESLARAKHFCTFLCTQLVLLTHTVECRVHTVLLAFCYRTHITYIHVEQYCACFFFQHVVKAAQLIATYYHAFKDSGESNSAESNFSVPWRAALQ